MIPQTIEEYAYLEGDIGHLIVDVDPECLFCDYLDKWLIQKAPEIKQNTYEGYIYRINHIKKYFLPYELKVKNVTSRHIDQFFKYELQFGKTNQKTKEKEPLSVRSVRSDKSILSAVFDQACIDGLIKTNFISSLVTAIKILMVMFLLMRTDHVIHQTGFPNNSK